MKPGDLVKNKSGSPRNLWGPGPGGVRVCSLEPEKLVFITALHVKTSYAHVMTTYGNVGWIHVTYLDTVQEGTQ